MKYKVGDNIYFKINNGIYRILSYDSKEKEYLVQELSESRIWHTEIEHFERYGILLEEPNDILKGLL